MNDELDPVAAAGQVLHAAGEVDDERARRSIEATRVVSPARAWRSSRARAGRAARLFPHDEVDEGLVHVTEGDDLLGAVDPLLG